MVKENPFHEMSDIQKLLYHYGYEDVDWESISFIDRGRMCRAWKDDYWIFKFFYSQEMNRQTFIIDSNPTSTFTFSNGISSVHALEESKESKIKRLLKKLEREIRKFPNRADLKLQAMEYRKELKRL